ncbi:cytochrome P450 4F6-like [Lytechinus pictus]|uniref:cytochrome P450 4F6-like n=1 Tax=Lytechinus pictus TaxID=7653 RepID=UPI0030B9B003
MAFWNVGPVAVLILTVIIISFGYKCLHWMIAAWGELKRIMHIRRTLPGPKPHWLFGNVLQEPGPLTPGFEWHRNMAKNYPRLHVFWVAWKPLVIPTHPDTVRNICNDKVGTVKSPLYGLFEEWLGNPMATSDGDLWKRHRRLITNTFHFNALKNYIPKINKVADTLISVISQRSEKEESLELHKTTSAFASDVILQCAFSFESDCQERESEYAKAVATLTDVVTKRTMNPLLLYEFFFRRSSIYKVWREKINILHTLQEKLISARREQHQNTGCTEFKKGMDFLDTLLLASDARGGLTDKEMRDEINSFIFGGVDTTSSALTWLIYLLATHPEYQTMVQEEVDELFKDREIPEIRSEDLHGTPFLVKCIKESQRMYSFVSPGRLLTEPLVVDGLTVPAGTEIVIYTYQLHHNPDVWGDDHMSFKPSRFDRENVEGRDPFAFLPFSAGARNCIAQQFALQEIQIAAIRIFDKFDFSLVRDSTPVFRVVSAPQDEILLGIHPRNKN